MKKLLVTSVLVFSLFDHDVLSIEVQQDAAKKISSGINLCKSKKFAQARDCLCELLIGNINYREKTGLYNLSHKDEARVRLYCAESLRSDGRASVADWIKIELILGALFRGKSPPFEKEEEFPSRPQSRRYHDDSELKTKPHSQSHKYYDDLLDSSKYYERSYKPHRSQLYLYYNNKFKSFKQKKEEIVFCDPLFKDDKIIRDLLTTGEQFWAKIYYAEALIHLKRYNDAVAILSKMSDSQFFPSTKPYISLLLGSAACQLGNFLQAKACFLRLFNNGELPASLSSSHAAMARVYYGKTLYELREFNSAEGVFKKLFPKEVVPGQMIDPEVPGFDLLQPEQQAIAIFSRAMALNQTNNSELCLKVFQRFTNKYFELLKPEQEALARLNYGTILLQKKLYSDAHQIFSRLYSKLEKNRGIRYGDNFNLLQESQVFDAQYNYALTMYYTERFEASIPIFSYLHHRILDGFIINKDPLWFDNVRFFYGKALYATKDFKGAAEIFSKMGRNALGTARGILYNALSRYQSGELDEIFDILSGLRNDQHLSSLEKSLACVCFGVLEYKKDRSTANLMGAFDNIFGNTERNIAKNTISELSTLMLDDIFNALFKSPKEVDNDAEVQEDNDAEVQEDDDAEVQEDDDDELSPVDQLVGGTLVRSSAIASGLSSLVQSHTNASGLSPRAQQPHRANVVFAPSPLAQSYIMLSPRARQPHSFAPLPLYVRSVSPDAHVQRGFAPLTMVREVSPFTQPTSVSKVSSAAQPTEKVINMLSPETRSLVKEYFALELCKKGRYSDTAKIIEDFFDKDGNCSNSCNGLSDRFRTRACYIKALRGIGDQTKADILSAVFYKRTAFAIEYSDAFKSLPIDEQRDLVNFKGVDMMN
ncbi:hypothetical protein FACS1894122_01780 [Alphaproteobacteria bacterium]|nr:hypothetical protein FACS1894122_01780 [Alphaproteobacteria bacterium]